VPARILIVEDNPTNLDLMSYLLESFGHVVARAGDGEAGLDAVRRSNFDLILADILMPKLDGHSFVRQVRREFPSGPPVLAVTALAMVGDRERILQSGFNGYIAKPITPETFVHEVDQYLTRELRSTAPGLARTPESLPLRAAQPTGRTILVVDDVPTNAELVRAALEPFGHDVVKATSMKEAIEAAGRRLPDLVVADVHMPDGTGYDLIRAFRSNEKFAGVPFIFLSSTYWHELDKARGLALGAQKFLLRPVDPKILLEEINDALVRING
jgi:CheY-like chemotaxis protein